MLMLRELFNVKFYAGLKMQNILQILTKNANSAKNSHLNCFPYITCYVHVTTG